MFFGRHDAKAETPVLWPPDAKSWLIGKDSDAGRDWGQEEKGMTDDEMAGWHHQLNGHEFEWTLGLGDGQGGLVCCDSWGCKELDTTELLNWTELMYVYIIKSLVLFWTNRSIYNRENKTFYLPQLIPSLILFLSLCGSEFLTYIIFFLSKEFFKTFLARQISWLWISSMFVYPKNRISSLLLKDNFKSTEF